MNNYIERLIQMKALVCELCGGNDFLKENDFFVCQNCGTKYTAEDAKKMMVEGTVEVQGTVKIDSSERLQNLYILARRARDNNDSKNAEKYYSDISLEDPNSWEAQFYKVYYSCRQIKIAEMGNSCVKLANCIGSVFDLIKQMPDEAERNNAYNEIYLKSLSYFNMILSNINEQAKKYTNATRNLDFRREHYRGVVVFMIRVGDAYREIGWNEQALYCYKACNAYQIMDPNTVTMVKQRIRELEPQARGGSYNGSYSDDDTVSALLVLLSFIPVVGIILGAVNISQNKRCGKVYLGIGIASFILVMLLSIIPALG